MTPWRATWSMVGRWLVYIPNPDGGEEQISLPRSMRAEAYKLGSADELLSAAEAVFEANEADALPIHILEELGTAIARARGEFA